MDQPPEQPSKPQPQPWGGQPWTRPQPPREPPPPQGWGSRRCRGSRGGTGRRRHASRRARRGPPQYRHPVGMVLIGAGVVIVAALIFPVLRRGPTRRRRSPPGRSGPATTAVPPPSTTAAQPPTAAEQLRQAVQAELGEPARVTSVTAPAGGDQVTVTWDIRRAGSRA